MSVFDNEPKFCSNIDSWEVEATIDGEVVQIHYHDESELQLLEEFVQKLIKNYPSLKTKIASDVFTCQPEYEGRLTKKEIADALVLRCIGFDDLNGGECHFCVDHNSFGDYSVQQFIEPDGSVRLSADII